MTDVTLPVSLKPKHISSLVRIGRDNDGGYLVDERNIHNADALIALGIKDDWSFEADVYQRNNIPVFAFDGTIDMKFFVNEFIKRLPKIYSPSSIIQRLNVILGYRKFFQGNKKHFQKLIGFDSTDGKFISMNTLFNQSDIKPFNNVFLKVDIEGWEYRALDQIIDHADKIEGMAIEFHDVDLHLDRITDFIARFPLHLVHTHANNWSPVTNEGIPVAIECTFSKEAASEQEVILPHSKDHPNNPDAKEFNIRFS